jgi:hypothetical protein
MPGGNDRVYPCAMSLDDFASFQPPYEPSPSQALQFRKPRIVCGTVVCLGPLVATVERHHLIAPLPALADALVVGFTLAAGLALVRFRRILARTRSAELALHQDEVEQRFKFTHCPNDRWLEVSERGFSLVCRCRRVAHLWSELVSLAENDLVFFLRTRTDVHVISKRTVRECRRLDELRALFHDRIKSAENVAERSPAQAALERDLAHA